MTQEIVRIVGSILSSDRMFSVGDGEVWIPMFNDDVFEVAKHVEHALRLHGYSATFTNTRNLHGVTVDVDAESISHNELKTALVETFGYKGRVAGLRPDRLRYDLDPVEAGNILEIPHVGWTGDQCRVVIGHSDGIHLAPLHSPNVETYNNDKIEIVKGENKGSSTTLEELIGNRQVIIKRREWYLYPQQAHP